MEIVDIAVNNLVPYDKNPRRNDEAAVKVAPIWLIPTKTTARKIAILA